MDSKTRERLARQAAGLNGSGLDPFWHQPPQLASIPLSAIDRDPTQPRRDLGELHDLALSIHEHGLLQPIIVEALPGDRFRILAGERRFAACRELGMDAMPCIVRTVAEQSRLVLQLIENLHRKNLHPLEVAQAYQRLLGEFGLTQRELAQRVGKSLSTVNEALRLLDLDPEVLADVRTSEQASQALLLEITKTRNPRHSGRSGSRPRPGS